MIAEPASAAQGMVLGTLFVGVAAVTDTAYALTAAAMAPVLRRRTGVRAGGRWLSGGTLVGLGLHTAFSESWAPRTG